tara:strand:+ start:1932 stop:4043 length:2112 start_codon:yes stop_codon:yes gene_type:complete
MAGPWERFEAPSEGPWSQFQPTSPEATPAPAEGIPGPRARPAWAETNPDLYRAAVTAREMVGPTVEALGAIGGGALGTVGGTPGLGTLAGAGAGYAGARQVLRIADQYLGLQPNLTPQEAVLKATEDIATGATLEAGGRVAGQVLAKGAEKFLDARRLAELKAASLARQSLGPNVTAANLGPAQRALQEAPEGATAAQALAAPGVYQPTTQAMLQRAAARTPESMGPTTGPMAGMTPRQQQDAINTLAAMAGGPTATAARASREQAVNALQQAQLPVRDVELRAINEAEVARRQFQSQANQMGAAAAQKVEDVRRFGQPGNVFERAQERAGRMFSPDTNVKGTMPVQVPGQPRAPGRYTYMGELATRADDMMSQAAEGSLRFGEAARFAQQAADSIAAHGLTPLKTDAVVGQITSVLKNPKYAGNRDVETVVTRVADDLQKWTDAGGVIDAFALDAIRRNSVNGAVRDLLGTQASPKAQKELAAKLLTEIRPAIDAAITKASGSNAYVNYLDAYRKGMQAVEQKQLSAEALAMFEKNPSEFVALVRGKKPDQVEDIFGPGSYNIAEQMAQGAMGKLSKIAETAQRAGAATEQAGQGVTRLTELLEQNLSKMRVPRSFDIKTANINKALDVLEQKLGKKVWTQLTEAAASADSFEALLKTVPASERYKILQVISNPAQYGMIKGAAAREVSNALAPEPENALAR